ncbi:MAG: hypothetical protein ABR537_12635 [Gemmatimonadales bacterium]
MRRTFASLALLAIVATSAQAQRAWQTEIGLQGGFTREVAAGSGADPTDAISLPGFNLGPALPFASGVYAIIPWKNKIAVDFDLGVSQLTGGLTATLFQLGARGDYAVTDHVYGAAGGALGYISNSGISETQLGLQGALGYRLGLSNSLKGRVEFRATFWGNTENVGPIDTYSLLFGVATSTHRSAAASRRPRVPGAWVPTLGFSAGYSNIHAVGAGADLTVLAFPSFGGGLANVFGPVLVQPPTVFAILPIGNKIAIEPGVDINRSQAGGTTTFLGNFSARLDYAVAGRWYAAAGGNLNYIKTTGTDAATRTGANIAWGYRFPFPGALTGRVELNYTLFAKNTDVGLPPVNVLGLMLGLGMPLR